MKKFKHLKSIKLFLVVFFLVIAVIMLARPSIAEACWPEWRCKATDDIIDTVIKPFEDVSREFNNCFNGNGCKISNKDIERELDNCIFGSGCSLSIPADEIWGEKGRYLYVDGASLIALENKRRKPRSLTTSQKAYLRPHYGSLVDNVTIKYDALTLDNWGLGGITFSKGSAGQTFCNDIYISGSYKPESLGQLTLLAHELYHSKQCRDLGGASDFGYKYFKEWKRANQNYAKNRMEIEASNFGERILTEDIGRLIHFDNTCRYPVEVALNYFEPNPNLSSGGSWVTNGWWTIEGHKDAYLPRTNSSTILYYARIPGTDYRWSGNGDYMRKIGAKNLPFAKTSPSIDKYGTYRIGVECDDYVYKPSSNTSSNTSSSQPKPTYTPTATPKPKPKAPPTSTPTPTPTPISCTNAYKFIVDVTIPDGKRLSPGESFVKTWRYRNTGTCTWDEDYRLKYYKGPRMDSPTSVGLPGIVRPGQNVDISVSLVAPITAGKHKTRWQLHAPDGTAFPITSRPFVEIVVEE